jgi:phage/plasmid-like protein (TIGR03299 family)
MTAVLELPDTEARDLPWAGITTGSVATGNGLATSEDLLNEADLNWGVVKRPLYRTMNDGTVTQSPGDYEIYRDDTEVKVGSVKGVYKPFSNHEAFKFGDSLVSDGVARWTDAGMQGDGYRVFMVMQLTNQFTVLGEDRVTLYLFLRASHDGSTGVTGYITPIRFFCTNQLTLITKTAENSFAIRHTSTIEKNLVKARESFQKTVSYQTAFTDAVERLASTPVSETTATLLIKSVIPDRRAKREAIVDGILHTYHHSPTVEPYRGTAYGLLNGLTEYMDHGKTQRTGNARFESIMLTEGAKARRQLHSRLQALV